jgi:hypothetical protein
MAAAAVVHRMPVGILDHLQTVCARQDQEFVRDVSRILGVPFNDMRRKVLGVLGTPTLVFTESNPWWMGTQCPIMAQHKTTGMWTRCSHACEPHGSCWDHRHTKSPVYTDPAFSEMATRTPFRFDGDLYWVGDDGSVLDATGTRHMDFTVNLKSRAVMYIKHARPKDRPSGKDATTTASTEPVAAAL